MQDRDETAGRPDEGGLTTERLAHPGADERSTAVYPGEATGDRNVGPGTGVGEDAREDVGEYGVGEYGGDERHGADAGGTTTDDLRGGDRAGADTSDTAGGTAVGTGNGTGAGGDSGNEPLLAGRDAEDFRTRWSEIQGRFVDDPQDAVRSADTLVAEVMQTLAATFASHKEELEGQWSKGEEVVTEDLRIALQRYRSFFNRLLTT
ncbi:hypothetical protein [Streptomyces sp. A1136]|uniref:hypothetical protein n=1 Tax=Streptomyces sp. A1136 TaxID=2563102 RepID=UPI0019D040D8|nr:hypothetical protein [Streptomyces sp. A1136]